MQHLVPVDTQPIIQDLQKRGFAVSDETPTVVRGDVTAFVGVDAPLEIVPVTNARPLTIISAISNTVDGGHVPLLLASQDCCDTVTEFLSPPFGLAGSHNGARQFYTTEGRIQLTDGSYACTNASETLSWTEVSESESAEPRQLQLMANDELIAIIESGEAIACPATPPASFRYRYRRNQNGQFVVHNGIEAVGTYPGVSAMRADGFQPIPAPLIPEQHIDTNAQLARATVLATVTDGSVQYIGSDED